MEKIKAKNSKHIIKNDELRKYTAVYTESVGRYGGCVVLVIRFEVKPGQKIMDALNEAGYERHKKMGDDPYDIAGAATHIFDGHPNLEGEYC
jgi:hypothetical protein